MRSDSLGSFPRRHELIGLDSSIFISCVRVLEWIDSGRGSAVTSTIILVELLVEPYRLGSDELVDQYYALLTTYPHLGWVEPGLEIADLAARLRAEHNLRTPDALQAATAMWGGATGFVSNDAAFRKLSGIEVLLLDDLLPRS